MSDPIAAAHRHPMVVQVLRYMLVGGLGTAVNALLFLTLRIWIESVPANLVAVVLSTVVSTEANRRFTFGGAAVHHWRNYVQNTGTIVFYAFYSSAVLLLLATFVDDPAPALEATCVALASVLGGTCRFLVMRYWVFGPESAAGPEDEPARTDGPPALRA